MLYNLRTKLNKRWFDYRARGIFNTPRVTCTAASNVIVLSQLHHPDLTMYMVAAKSFCRFIRPARFVIVDDGLTDDDRQTLLSHFENMTFVPSSEVSSTDCPKGGCWERLLSIAALNSDHYVIQLDADTITLNRPDAVIASVLSNTSFTLGTEGGHEVITTAEASRIAADWEGDHVQVVAEQALYRLPASLGTQYVHGCAGFAGFHAGCIDRARVETVSRALAKEVKTAKWQQWGSEQVASNFLVSNSSNPTVLNPETYPFWRPGLDVRDVKLVHFFGTHRFEGGRYVELATSVVRALQ
jgi:hypothetical protein